MYGQEGLQKHIRKDVKLAHQFEDLVKQDSRFEIIGKVTLGLVCIRLKKTNEINEKLIKSIYTDGRIHMVPAKAKGVYFLRFGISGPMTMSDDVIFAWKVIRDVTETDSSRKRKLTNNHEMYTK